MRVPVPAVDLFSGPGGLAEGFASCRDSDDREQFRIALSIEVDAAACRTLRLRTFLRKFGSGFPEEYYEYLNGVRTKEPDWEALYPAQWSEACDEARQLKLGTPEATSILQSRNRKIRRAHKGRTVLLGGPPCQSYSLVGRARTAGMEGYDSDRDERQSLYLEYARALGQLRPTVAIMENVRGMLSAKRSGRPVFPDVMEALGNAGGKGRYHLFSLAPDMVGRSWSDGLDPEQFLVRAEAHGVPQARHRVFVVCIRRDVARNLPEHLFPRLEPRAGLVSVEDVIGGMPALRSRLSCADDGQSWQRAIRGALSQVKDYRPPMARADDREFLCALKEARVHTRGPALPCAGATGSTSLRESCPAELRSWLFDANLSRLPNNDTRGHISEDLARYLYAAVYARAFGKSPRAADFPQVLAPDHASWGTGKFDDRFRVQVGPRPSTTVTSHISKDGHYFIHPDPSQCRSLTVREAARLQTFPDNYLFQGGRTSQYVQVGNAVPPFLAKQIAKQVAKIVEYQDDVPRKAEARRRRPSAIANGAELPEIAGTRARSPRD